MSTKGSVTPSLSLHAGEGITLMIIANDCALFQHTLAYSQHLFITPPLSSSLFFHLETEG